MEMMNCVWDTPVLRSQVESWNSSILYWKFRKSGFKIKTFNIPHGNIIEAMELESMTFLEHM